MDKAANYTHVEKVMSRDWSTRTLGATAAERFELVKQLKLIPPNAALCRVCRAIDWEYLLFGSSNGVDTAGEDTASVGSRSNVEQRAASGCPSCAGIFIPLLQDIDDYYQTKQSPESCVSLYVNDLEDYGTVSSGHRSYRLQAALGPGKHSHCHDLQTDFSEEVNSSGEVSVMSRSCVVQIDDESSAYRSVPQYVDFSQCQKWLKTCFEDHESCKAVQTLNAKDPIKLVDTATRRVVSFAQKGSIEYATLSYVCGPGYSLCVLQGSQGWSRDEDGRPYHPLPASMPATLRDAMAVVQKLNMKYLWVDSICIAQDDDKEKQTQISQMFNIYNDAAICIVSADGLDSHAPLPGVSIPRQKSPAQKALIKKGLCLGLTLPALDTVLANYRYMYRGWTYQELILSKRTLIFTTEEVYCYCAQSMSRESLVEQTGQDPGAEALTSLALQAKIHIFGNAVTLRKTTDLAKLCRLFTTAAQEYSSRTLSYQEDAISAFYGLLELFTQLFRAHPVSGCPGSLLLNALTWKDSRRNISSADLAKRRMCTKSPNTPVLPTWMWCSYDGPIELTALPSCYTKSVCHIHDPQWESEGYNSSFSRFSAAICHTCSIPSHTTPVHHPMPLPIKTKSAGLCVLARGDDASMPGRANMFTVDGEKLGACDFRGQCTLDRLDGSEITFVQLYSDSYYTILPSVTVLVLETCKLKETIGAFDIGELQKVIAELLQPNRRLPQIAVEPPEWDVAAHQAYEEDDDIRIRLVSKLCPEAIQVHPGCVPDIDNVLVGSRIGIASIGLEQWIMLQPKESLVFLV